MRLRKSYLRQGQGLTDSATYVFDVSVNTPVTALILFLEATNGATSCQDVMLISDIDKIELVDGSFVIFSMTGIEARALAFWLTGKLPYLYMTESAAGVQAVAIPILFGRYVGDKEFYLDPSRFTNLQLKVTTSLTISATVGFATGTGALDALAVVFDDSPGPAKGYMMAKNIYSWTTAASGEERIDLPVDFPYRLLMVRSYETAIALTTDITNLEMNCDSGGYRPFDLEMAHLIRLGADWRGAGSETWDLLRTDGDTVTTLHPYPEQIATQVENDLDLVGVDAITVNTLVLQLLSVTVVPAIAKSTTDTQIQLSFKSICPYCTVAVPFGDLEEQDEYFPADRYKDIDLIATQGGAGAAASVVLQQVAR